MDIVNKPRQCLNAKIQQINLEDEQNQTQINKYQCIEDINQKLIEHFRTEIESKYQQLVDINRLDNYDDLHKCNAKTVRFIGQVQNVIENQISIQGYIDKQGKIRHVGFEDPIEQNVADDFNNQVLKDSQVVFCIPIQGLNQWVYDKNEQNQFKVYNHGQKGYLALMLQHDLLTQFKFLVNKIVEVIGIFEIEKIDEDQKQEDELNVDWGCSVDKVPRMQVLLIKQLDCSQYEDQIVEMKQLQMVEDGSIINFMNELFQDQWLSELVLITMIQGQFMFDDGDYVGKTIFNISHSNSLQFKYQNISISFTQLYISLCQKLLIKNKLIQINNNNLKSINLEPTQNFETNVLEYGELQLTDETLLVLDETNLQPGKLDTKTIKNAQSLTKLMMSDMLGLDYNYSKVFVKLVLPVVILSESKSILEWDLQIKIQQNQIVLSDNQYNSVFTESSIQDSLRLQLIAMKHKIKDIQIPTDVADQIKNVFMELNDDGDKVNNFQRKMQLSKSLAVVRGSNTLQFDMFNQINTYYEQNRKK